MTPLDRKENIIRLCNMMKWASLIFTGLLIFAWAFMAFNPSIVKRLAVEQLGISKVTYWGIGEHLLVMFAAAISLTFLITIILQLRKLFVLYEQGKIFDHHAASHLKSAGLFSVAFATCSLLTAPLLSLLLTLENEVGERTFSLSFSSSQITAFFFGILLIVIGRIMQQAAIMNEENQQFI